VTSFVLDNSVAMRWCFEDAANAYADTILARLEAGDEAIVPALWRYEVSAVLARAQLAGTLTAPKSAEFLEALQSLKITIDVDGIERILTEVHQVAIEHRLTSYDAAYLELAIRRNLPLATLDRELVRACHSAGTPLLG
jgi:predicted nucleic acid-binding protein